MSLEEILACPVCHAPISGQRCTNCGRTYSEIRGVFDMTPVPLPDPELEKRATLWDSLQENGELAYRFDPTSSLSVGERDDARAFARFAQLRGRVLDVGCGPQKMPSYGEEFEGELVGIDPLVGVQPRDFEFVKGVGEYLPFRDESFDRVLFATSIDHMLSPALGIVSAARVTKRGGTLSVWIGEASPLQTETQSERFGRALDALRARDFKRSRTALRRALRRGTRTEVGTAAGTLDLEVPQGAIDPFHFAHPTVEHVIGWLEAARLEVHEVDDSVPGSGFIRARRPGEKTLP